jgi:hypothetical protein
VARHSRDSGPLRGEESAWWVSVVGRPLVLVLWCFFGWGTLMLVALLHSAIDVGLAETLARLRPDQEHGIAGVVNLLCAAVAAGIWLLIAWNLWLRRRPPSDPPRDP